MWVEAIVFGLLATAALVLGQRFGLLRAIEALVRGMARRWPSLEGASLDGLHEAALKFYGARTAIINCTWLHLIAWLLGSIETWAVLNVCGAAVTPLQAFTVESLGMAARSAGFALPAAIGAQEGGFILAAAAIGVATAPALALSLVKRLREIIVGLIGLALWGLATHRGRALS